MYKAVLKTATQWIKDGCSDKEKICLESIFPEFLESEDERIRKAIVGLIEELQRSDKNFAGVELADMLSYLEKQKEQKHPNGCFTCDEYKKGYEEGRRNGFTAGYNKAMKEVEQKEQKPVVTLGETYHVDTLGTQQVIAGKMPQKPAEWSEEDKHNLNSVINLVHATTDGAWGSCIGDGIEKWLKSLRPQSKDEIYKEKDNAFKLGKHQLAIQFMNYLDENRPEGKMSLSNGECEDIDKAFKENDWAKILRYAEKYGK